ncbi:9044_t:CDS:2, partial [Entrophospora sp. SA101]
FLGDNVSNTRSEKVINSRKESLWLLIDDLYNTFNGTIPLENSLFKDVKEFNDEGLNNIFTCYNKGIQRLYTMLNGEVLQNVTIKGTVNTTIESSSNIPPPSTDLEQPLPTKNTRYRPSQDEKKILENLASFNEMPSMDKIDPVLNSLLLLNPNHWNARKILLKLFDKFIQDTNREMLSVLISTFSGYGIFNLAAKLGSKFLDKLDDVVDYRATYISQEDNNVLKVWYLFYKWAGYWEGHKIENLIAFAPVTGKYNYYRATVNFLAYLCKNPDQVNLLSKVCSVNFVKRREFDEAMEIYGIKYIKQNISRNLISKENLMKEIKSMQSRKERINVSFSEFWVTM